jgi:hypothetical protein
LTIFFIETLSEIVKFTGTFISPEGVDFKLKISRLSREEIVIALLAAGTYLLCLLNDFHTDDWIVLSFLRDGFSLSDFASMENAGRFRPLTNILVYVRYLVFGDTSCLYYAVNIFLHAVISILLYRLLLKLELPERAALISSLFFAIYFQHYEAVLWIYGTIRELAAITYIVCIWNLHNHIITKSNKSFGIFVVASFLGLFVVEDFVVSPAIFALFALLFAGSEDRRKILINVLAAGIVSLAVYFTIRSLVIVRPGIVEEYYYPGLHMVRVLFEYMGWFVIPSPAHPYFKPLADSLPSFVFWLWRIISYAAIFGFLPLSLWLFIRSSKQVRFFVLFVFVTMLPIIPLNYKVSSRNIYLPSIGLAVMAGYLIYWLIWRSDSGRAWLKRMVLAGFLLYMGFSIAAVDITSLEYRSTQQLVAGIIDDLRDSGVDLNNCDYVLLDNVPGRAIVGPSMIYRLHYRRSLFASNDPVKGPIDIAHTADSLYNEGVPIIVFDYRSGHMVEATAEYIHRGDSPEPHLR